MKKEKISKIEKHTNIAELLFKHPETAEVLLIFGLHCVGCPASSADTIEAGAKLHGFTDSQVDELVTRINEVIEHQE